MMIYLYDGTVEGFLTVVFEIYDKKALPDAISVREESQTSFLIESLEVETDLEKAARVEKGILKNVGNEGFSDFVYAFFSDEANPNREMVIFNWIRAVLRYGKKATQMYNLDAIKDFNDIVHKVTYEIHRFRS